MNVNFSIMCIYNNPTKLKNLESSIDKQKEITYEKIFIDNTKQQYTNAKEALKVAASKATGKYYLFSHQDIILEDEETLKKIYNTLENIGNFGIAGVAGKKGKRVYSNIFHGQDKIKVDKEGISKIEEVDSVDECLFIISKDTYASLKFGNLICNTWHLYAVEYSLEMKEQGKKVIVLPIELYHESAGASFDNTYYKQIKMLVKKYRRKLKTINTTMGNWHTNKILLELQIAKRRIKDA